MLLQSDKWINIKKDTLPNLRKTDNIMIYSKCTSNHDYSYEKFITGNSGKKIQQDHQIWDRGVPLGSVQRC